MAKRKSKSRNLALQSLELIGKPTFFLFTFIVTSCYGLFVLITKILHSIKVPKFHFPKGSDLKGRTQPRRRKGGEGQTLSVLLKIALIAAPILILAFLTYWFVFRGLPSVHLLSDSPPSLTTKIYDRNGVLLYQIYKDQNRSLIKLHDLPQVVINATLAAEDKNFYHHHGFSFIGIIRAATNNVTRGTTQGGSTITQQLVKNVLLSPEKSFTRKIKELVLAVETEMTYSKDQILEMYLNQVGYGGTSYGIEQASHEYFGKSARDLTLAEAGMLAGLPIAPTTLSPFGTNPYLGKIRQQQVLEAMVASKMITENEKVAALAIPLVFHPQDTSILAPHFVMYVKDQLVKEYGEDLVNRGGLQVTTTLDLDKQTLLQTQINTELAHLQNLHVQNGAGLIVSPGSGEILAMVGSRNFFDTEHDGQVNLVLQKRQPGSSIKPITYALAFLRGATPSSTIDDSPVCFVLAGQADYCPHNYDGRFHGVVTIRTALGSSYNIPAIKTLNTYGIMNMVELARTLGITTWDDPSRFGLSLTLGGGEITMLDLASVYSVFADSGLKVPFKSIMSIHDSRGVSLSPKGSDLEGSAQPERSEGRSDPVGKEVLPPGIAYQISSILADPAARAPAFGFNSVLNLPGANVAVKTGTTNDLRDNWTFGYTHDFLVATWVGNNDNTPMSSVASGITGASPIWARTMQALVKTSPATPFLPPDSMIKVNLSCSGTPNYQYFIPGTAPRLDCSATLSGSLLNAAAATSR
jgi:penicillin-binding protein 1C